MSISFAGTSVSDPTSYRPDGIAEVDTYVDGAPLLQGKETGTLMWAHMSDTQFSSMHGAWNTNKGVLTAGTLPKVGSAGYDNATCYWHEPVGEIYGGSWHNVTARVTFVTRS